MDGGRYGSFYNRRKSQSKPQETVNEPTDKLFFWIKQAYRANKVASSPNKQPKAIDFNRYTPQFPEDLFLAAVLINLTHLNNQNAIRLNEQEIGAAISRSYSNIACMTAAETESTILYYQALKTLTADSANHNRLFATCLNNSQNWQTPSDDIENAAVKNTLIHFLRAFKQQHPDNLTVPTALNYLTSNAEQYPDILPSTLPAPAASIELGCGPCNIL